jgi:polysaccharide chain length determinant protein (PEP-CTERM system associated)
MKPGTPENKFSPLSILRALNRRKLWLLVPMVVLISAAWFYAQSLPQRYRAKALIGSEPLIPGQSAPNNRVDPGTVNAQESLRIVRETIFSPAVLEGFTREFGVDKAASAQPESTDEARSRIQLCKPEFMQLCRNVTVQLEGPDAFYVGFESGNPEQAAKVANRLAGLFVERSADLRGRIAEQQGNALDAEVDRLRNQLSAQEAGLESYKGRVSQELPEMLAGNLKELETLHQEIQNKADQISDAEARRTSIIEEMQALEKQGVLLDEPPAKTSAQVALDDLRLKLNQLKTRYTPEHPEILRTEKEIRDLEATSTQVPAASHAPTQGQLRYFSLQAELKSIDSRLVSYRKSLAAPISQVPEYERRINLSPGYETAVAERTKDAAMLRARYETLFAKQQEARLNQRTETTGRGFAFTILEAAQVPATPSSPHRSRILLFGLMAGLGLGLAGVFIVERLDTAFETAEDFEKFSSHPVL